ncbi:MAG: ABC transporter ATP-binding protein [Deltaproteobacteria bacterium]|nr:ABC transporter ATP-binding protein [Deltaproteobacteria bacterium]
MTENVNRQSPLLCIRGLKVAIDGGGRVVRPIDGVDLEIARGECLCLVGESGSGKSTLAYALMGLLPPGASIESGSVVLDGRDMTCLWGEERRAWRGTAAAMVFQEPMTALNPLMTVGAQVVEAMTVHGTSRREAGARAAALLGEVGMTDPVRVAASYPHQLSGGMRQRALIAMALANGPALLIADEPTSAVDVTIARQVLTLLMDLRRARGMAVLLITHDFGVVIEAADTVAVMYAGRVVERGPVRDVLASPRHPYTAALFKSVPGRSGVQPGEPLPAIPGAVPDLVDLPEGCRFRPRCSRAVAACTGDPPETVEGTRVFRCFNPLDRQAVGDGR